MSQNPTSESLPLRVVQITDTHLFADDRQTMLGHPTNAPFQSVIAEVARLQPQPDLLLLTGDLSQDETEASYGILRSHLDSLQIPTYWIAGNHDQELAVMEQVLKSDWISGDKVFQRGGWDFILLNSMIPGQPQGRLSEETLLWFEQQLQRLGDCPILVAVHHHLLPIGSACMDRIQLENPEAFFEIVDRHSQVKVVICGHIHQEFDQMRDKIRYLGSPSTCIQLKPFSDNFTMDTQSPGFRMLLLYPDGRCETEVRRVDYAIV
ncbi:MAG: 3',5'-cyclic-AMP phosphodiesterase [Oculatellaceae cyanobacterium Prado106]|jgi:Icc protein|nr:3',5'-cyclic-AMP phosphodiesterase [Oculatellaceae cyanobacterium Prado106]